MILNDCQEYDWTARATMRLPGSRLDGQGDREGRPYNTITCVTRHRILYGRSSRSPWPLWPPVAQVTLETTAVSGVVAARSVAAVLVGFVASAAVAVGSAMTAAVVVG